MYKLEIICENCDRHFVLVTRDEVNNDETIYCCFCGASIDLSTSEEDE